MYMDVIYEEQTKNYSTDFNATIYIACVHIRLLHCMNLIHAKKKYNIGHVCAHK